MSQEEIQDQEEPDYVDTVFFNQKNFTIKHPLKRTWTLWFDNPNHSGRKKMEKWEEGLEKIYTISYIEDFWSVFNNAPSVDQMAMGASYHFFLEGVKPMWEDPANERGGKWVAQIPRATKADRLSQFWLNTLLMVIGETCDYSEEITGAVLSLRKAANKISLWTSNSASEESCKAIGRYFKDETTQREVGYQSHQDALKHGSSFTNNNRYQIK